MVQNPNVAPGISCLKNRKGKIKGKVVLMKKNVWGVDIKHLPAAALDRFTEFVGKHVTLHLISAVHGHPGNGNKGKVGKAAHLKSWIASLPSLTAGESVFKVKFDWEEEIGIPGAFLIKNNHFSEFYLVSLTLEDIPNHGSIHFDCNSWIYPASRYNKDRIFFLNKSYLPSETPEPLQKYRAEELASLRGDGTGELKKWGRIYDYDTYNDLGEPDDSADSARPVLGGSSTYPYPRRGRTGRPPTQTDPKCESRASNSRKIYIPSDEKFGPLKKSDFVTYQFKSIIHGIIPKFHAVFKGFSNEFDSFEEVKNMYSSRLQLHRQRVLKKISDRMPLTILKEIFRTDGEQFLRFPVPKVIQVDKSAWMTDVEFAREMIAGVNPNVIRGLQEFPPRSKLDRNFYGDQNSKITREHIKNNLEGLTVDEALSKKKLFILDHHDPLMPYLKRINETNAKGYASRTILFLKSDGTLKPLAIELSLPNSQGDQFGAISKVYLPADRGVDSFIWQLAKAYVVVNDSCHHQLVSHWLNTHAVIEPFVIATNRHLSVLHPVHKLLLPHYRDTMKINSLARGALVNANGIIESSFLWGRYSMEMGSKVYKNWVFPEQALPADLIKRGMAIEDPNSSHGVRLLVEDYPYAVDGLEIWAAIKTWVHDYCYCYYKSDDMIRKDTELQAWWKEVVEVGHGDLKNEPWWFKMQTCEELIETCTIVIWISSALHAAVNFGQYPYGGYILNRPTLSRRFMPEEGTPEYGELGKNPEKAYLRTFTPKKETLMDLSVIEILSRHSSDECYLGQRDSPYWTSDQKPLEAFKKFGKKLAEIEEKLIRRNMDEKLRNRVGPVKMPYTLLYPSSEEGLTCRGIPNSISI